MISSSCKICIGVLVIDQINQERKFSIFLGFLGKLFLICKRYIYIYIFNFHIISHICRDIYMNTNQAKLRILETTCAVMLQKTKTKTKISFPLKKQLKH